MMIMIIVGIAFLVGAGIAVAMAQMAAKVPDMMVQRKVDDRLQEIAFGGRMGGDDKEKAPKSLLKSRNVGAMPSLDQAISSTSRGSVLASWIEQSGTKASVSTIVIVAFVTGIIGAVAIGVFTRMPWFMVIGFAIGASVPVVVLRMKRTRRLRSFEEQFPEALDLIARALKAGHAFATGLKMAAEELPEPVGPEFRKTFDEQNFGLPLKDALDNLTIRIPILDVKFFATAVLIQRETGGNLSEILENLAHVVRERFKILRQVRVYTAHGRLTGYVLLALPAALGGALAFINPDHMNLLFRERIGQMLLLIALGMQTAGYLWIRQIVKIEV